MNDLMSLGADTYVQMFSMLVYVAAIAWGCLAFIDIKHSKHHLSWRYMASALTLLSVSTALIFIFAQIPWIVGQQWRVMTTAEMMAWLLYDWLNGLAHLTVVLAVRAFMRWEFPTPCQSGGVCPSGILIRREREQDAELKNMARDIMKIQRRIEALNKENPVL